MIDEIQVRNLALIREASLEPSRGLTVLTGETGAGKTALLSALKLLMGARASADLVRDGEEGLVVSGRFFGLARGESGEAVGGGQAGNADDAGNTGAAGDTGAVGTGIADDAGAADNADSAAGTDDADDETVVSRRVTAEGRSRASVDGTMASVRELADLVAPSIDLCGQFEHQQLMRPHTHVSLLDAWAGDAVAGALAAYRAALEAAGEAAVELARVREAQESSSAKLDDARFVLSRIDEVAPQEGEYEELQRDLGLAEHAESLATAAATAYAALSEDGGALDSLNTAAASLEAAGRVDADLARLAESLREAGFVLEDVSGQARDYRDKIDFDPAELAAMQERYAAMQGLLRAYGPRMEDVLARRAEAADLVSMAGDSGARLREAQRAVDAAEAALAQAADALDKARESAAPRFAAEVTQVMNRLQMAGSELVCAQDRMPRGSWGKSGPSSFEFLYRPTEGAHPRPLARIASGGEVSRVMLAVKVVLGDRDAVDTLVFDEVDAGVGGAVAVSLADEIANLAQTHQVIVVTHLAQVAVRGEAHYVVQREEDETHLVQIAGDAREREIARMLSGSITDASLAHARELLGA